MSRPSAPLIRWFQLGTLLLFILACSLGGAACTSDVESGVAPTPVIPSADGGPGDVAPAGVLRVRIAGLPAGKGGFVTVEGASDLSKQVFVDTDLSLPAGSYTVVAGGVGDSTVPNGDVYRAKVRSQKVDVAAGAGTTVHVDYEKITVKIAARVKVVADTTAAVITSVQRDAATGRATLSLDAATPESSAWQPGDILTLGSTAATPKGFFGRIVSSDGKTIVTEAIKMQDVIEEGVLSFHHTYLPQEVLSVSALDSGVLPVTVCPSISASLPASKGSLSAALKTTGQFCFTPAVDLDVSFSGKVLPDVYFKASAEVSASLLVEGTASIGIGIKVPIYEVELAHWTIWTGPIPWVITPQLSISVGADGSVTAGVRAGVTATVSAYGGFSYDSHSGNFSPFKGKSTSWSPIWPEPTATATLKAYAGPEFTLLIDELAGPEITLYGYAQFDVDFLRQPLWQLHAGVDLAAGISTNKLFDIDYTVPLYNYDVIIAQSTDTPPVAAKVSTLKTTPSDQGVVVAPDDTMYIASSKNVVARKVTGNPLWTYAANDYVELLARGANGTIYAADFTGGVYAINANGTEKWKIAALGGIAEGLALNGTNLYVSNQNGIYPIDATTGAVGTMKNLGEGVWGVTVGKDGTVYAATSQHVTALDATLANVLWSRFTGPVVGGAPAIGPDGTLYVGAGNGVGGVDLIAVNADGTLKFGSPGFAADAVGPVTVGPDKTVYLCGTNPAPYLVAFDGVTGDKKWVLNHADNCKSAPLLSNDGKAYFVTDRTLRAVQTSNGQVLWAVSLPSPYGSPTGSPNFLSTGDIVAGNQGGTFVYHAGGNIAASGWPRAGGNVAGTSTGK